MVNKVRNYIRRGPPQSTFVSYIPFLKQLCLQIAPQTVLEFGPGYSTEILLKCSNAEIVTLETDPNWYNRYKDHFASNRVEVILKQPGWNFNDIKRYGQNFSLVFIDGGDRVAALKYSYNLIDDTGVVFLHDAHREDYEEGIRCYPFVYFPERHSCLLFKGQSLYRALKKSIPADYSCKCQYCSSEQRRKYLAQFIQQD